MGTRRGQLFVCPFSERIVCERMVWRDTAAPAGQWVARDLCDRPCVCAPARQKFASERGQPKVFVLCRVARERIERNASGRCWRARMQPQYSNLIPGLFGHFVSRPQRAAKTSEQNKQISGSTGSLVLDSARSAPSHCDFRCKICPNPVRGQQTQRARLLEANFQMPKSRPTQQVDATPPITTTISHNDHLLARCNSVGLVIRI